MIILDNSNNLSTTLIRIWIPWDPDALDTRHTADSTFAWILGQGSDCAWAAFPSAGCFKPYSLSISNESRKKKKALIYLHKLFYLFFICLGFFLYQTSLLWSGLRNRVSADERTEDKVRWNNSTHFRLQVQFPVIQFILNSLCRDIKKIHMLKTHYVGVLMQNSVFILLKRWCLRIPINLTIWPFLLFLAFLRAATAQAICHKFQNSTTATGKGRKI